MADWSDSDDDLPQPAAVVAPRSVFSAGDSLEVPNFDDEEDLALVEEAPVVVQLTDAQIAAANKKAAQDEARLAAKIKEMQTADETPEQRKLREKKEIEDAEIAMASDLFGGGSAPVAAPAAMVTTTVKKTVTAGSISTPKSSGASLASVSLKTKTDHVTFATAAASRLKDSTAFCLAGFYKELNTRLVGNLDLKDLTAMIQVLQSEEQRKKDQKGATATVVSKDALAISKKEAKKKAKKHYETFGGADDDDMYEDEYEGMYDKSRGGKHDDYSMF